MRRGGRRNGEVRADTGGEGALEQELQEKKGWMRRHKGAHGTTAQPAPECCRGERALRRWKPAKPHVTHRSLCAHAQYRPACPRLPQAAPRPPPRSQQEPEQCFTQHATQCTSQRTRPTYRAVERCPELQAQAAAGVRECAAAGVRECAVCGEKPT